MQYAYHAISSLRKQRLTRWQAQLIAGYRGRQMWKYGLFSEMASAVTGSRSANPAPDGPRRTSVLILELLPINSNISEAHQRKKSGAGAHGSYSEIFPLFGRLHGAFPGRLLRTFSVFSFQSLSRYREPCTNAIVHAPWGWGENLLSAFEPRHARIRHPKWVKDSKRAADRRLRPTANPVPADAAGESNRALRRCLVPGVLHS